MKLKIMALLVAMLAIVTALASCKPSGGGGDDDGDKTPPKYSWGKTDILVQLYENSNNGELEPGLKRYCAGQDTAGTDEIDSLVKDRNLKAYADANVSVKYNYEIGFGWGGSTQDIQTLATSGAATAPDIFANFAYDMTSCALRGCFANLLANTDKTATTYGMGGNYFAFTKDDYVGINPDAYFDSNAGQGYFYDYMQSLAFVNENNEYDKMYCLASNYCVDAIRSFLVIPVNINMLESISVVGSTGDVNGDGAFDVEDFYSLVWDYKWTYDALATLSKSVYSPDNNADPNADILDTLGICLGNSSGLTASGVLYTTSVGIIEKYQDSETGKWSYKYPETNNKLVALADALTNLFKNNTGLATLDSAQAKAAGLGDGSGELAAIRSRFAQDKVLFGGIIAVGSLEDTVYQQMNEPGKKGFGVVPIPLYTQSFDDAGNPSEVYQTLVHNLARIFAISATTSKFDQCTAFLDYQSTNSKDILEMYYNQNLVAAVDAGKAATHNVNMLNYIRSHVRDCFDKTYEDVISNYQLTVDKEASSKRWHGIFSTNAYQVSNMSARYAEESPAKQTQLVTVLAEWAKLK